jgi:hypothetical protein
MAMAKKKKKKKEGGIVDSIIPEAAVHLHGVL